MSEDEIIRSKLKAKLTQLEEALELSKSGSGTVELDQASVGRLSRIDALQRQQVSLAADRRRQQQISRIRSALQRLEEGEYGICLRCGEELSAGRLEVDPAATLCITCA